MVNGLTKEREIVILLSRLTFSEAEISRVYEIISQKPNWFEVYKYGLYHKTVALCINNLKKIKPGIFIPKILNSAYVFISEGNKHVAKLYKQEIEALNEKLARRGIACIPVKGSSLIKTIYKDEPGTRYMGDADFLVKHEDTGILHDVLTGLGYVQTTYDKTGKLVPISRAELIKWKMYMSHLPKYRKTVESPYVNNIIEFDFRFALDDTLNREPVNEMIEFYQTHHCFAPSHELMHLCTHFYDEAKHLDTIKAAKDLNLIKLCDIREFVLANGVEQVLEDTYSFAKKHKLEKQFYMTLYYLQLIYNDGYETLYMQKLDVDDYSFLHTFKSDANNEQNQFKKDFWERLFSCGNENEITKG